MTSNNAASNPAPISAHRYFPVIVALWFAALLGLGSLVLPAALPEMIVTSLGLDSLVPVLAPPHGFTARILIALVATIIGGAAGLFLARKIAAMQAYRPSRSRVPGAEQVSAPSLRQSDQHPDAPARRPISALEELGEDRLADGTHHEIPQAGNTGSATPVSGRRRALTLTREDGPSDWPQHAPLPGITEIPGAEDHAPITRTAGFSAPDAPHGDVPAEDDPIHSVPLELDNEQGSVAKAEPDQTRHFDEPSPLPSAPFAKPDSDDALIMAEAEPPAPRDLPVTNSIRAAAPIAQRPLAELGMAELVERLAYAMQHCATPVPEAQNNQAAPEPEESAQDDAEIAADTHSSVIPAALCPIELALGADDDDGEIPGFALAQKALAPFAADASLTDMTQDSRFFPETSIGEIQPEAPVSIPVAPDTSAPMMPIVDNDDETEDQTGIDETSDYSSLLNLKTDLSQPTEFVRIDEPAPEAGSLEPVVVFPGHEMRRTPAPEGPQTTQADLLADNSDAGADMAGTPAPPPGPFPVSSASRPFDSPPSGDARPDFGKPVGGKEADPAETERALRAALASLQRMSGAA